MKSIKAVKSLEDSDLLMNGIRDTIQSKEQKGGIIGTLLSTLRTSLLINMLANK